MFKGINQRILLLAVLLGLVTSTVVFFLVTAGKSSQKEKLADVVAVKKIPAKSSRLSLMIPRGQRAVTVAVNEVSGISGMLQPGDCVDVLATFDQNTAGQNVTSLFLQNISILAVGQDTEVKEKKGESKTTVTLLVDPWQAEQLALAEEKGVLRLALRPFKPESNVFTTNVVLRDLTRLAEPVDTPPPVYSAPAPHREYQEPEKKKSGRQIELIKGSKKETIEL